ncbi:MAG: 50S ribosome-binding GTPase [Bacilli bacterium]|nr:50S ribosome-binding GTPase [Bacilli bacterium]MDD4547726.1 50S ribosome-binding GTPase [Bacilli bacterium]
MIKKCLGCGVELQNQNKEGIGYITSLDKQICERCFRIQNYNEYKVLIKDNEEFVNILKEINKTNDLVLVLIDIFNMSTNIELIKANLSNDIILVITKYDLLKPYLKEEKLLKYIDDLGMKSLKTIIISSNKNYNFDLLMSVINKHKKSKNVYVVGNTNVGKSTMINKIIYNYTNNKSNITTSMLPSTTLSNIAIDITDDLTIIDTPGLLEEHNLIDYVDVKELSKIVPKTVVKPLTFQIKVPQTIIIDDFAKLQFDKTNDVTMYISNKLDVKRVYKETESNGMKKHVLKVPANNDIVIKGLGFIKVKKAALVVVYTIDNVMVYTRKSLI